MCNNLLMSEARSASGPTAGLGSAAVRVQRLGFQVVREGGKPVDRATTAEGDVLRVGSHPSNELVLDDPTVSRFHCRALRTPRGWMLVDSDSRNGTHVNGVQVREAFLAPGSVVSVGQSSLRVEEETAEIELAQTPRLGALVGSTEPMLQLFDRIRRVAPTEVTVLIEGESGTGKELVAAEVVRGSKRAKAPFVVVDCGAVPPNLIESELFGHVKGAFTGASSARAGAFQNADGGTIFLDEIGELPLELQPKLLRALEAREVRRVGDDTSKKISVRVLAATNRQLEREVNAGRFREDLYFRLSVVTLRVPPLRDRLDDLPVLVLALLAGLGLAERAAWFDGPRLAEMQRHTWPGNVRELRNYVERAVVLGDEAEPPKAPSAAPRRGLDVDASRPFKEAKSALVSAFEREYLTAALASAGGNITAAAKKAGIDRMYFHRLLQKYGLHANAPLSD